MAEITVAAPEAIADMDVAISLDAIEKEVREGLTGHTDRLDSARDNVEFYAGRNVAFLQRRESEEFIDFTRRPKRTSRLTRKVIRTLTADLYNPGPTRKLENGEAEDKWLQEVYKANHINALMQSADRMATLNATCAVQATCTGKPEKPIALYLWGAHEFVPFFTSDDHTTPWAVCTIALVVEGQKKHRRLELWSAKEHRVYTTKEVAVNATMGGDRAQFRPDLSGTPAGSAINPYGCLPFEFVHDELPVTDFWEGGIGSALREANAELDRELSDLAQHVQKYLNPDGWLVNVAANFRSARRPGGWQHLPPGKNAEGDPTAEPKAFYTQAQLAVEAAWLNITNFANATLEELDVPLVAVRADASTDLSGIAIVAKHIPLLNRTKSRQVPFVCYETNLAKLVCTVCGNYYGEPRLQAAGKDTRLSVAFPTPAFPLPTPERDAADDYEVARGYKSDLQVIQERYGLTREQALGRLEQIVKDKADAEAIRGPEPAPPPNPNAQAAPDADGGKEPAAQADATADDDAAYSEGKSDQ